MSIAADQRVCSICNRVIPHDTEYRSGWTTPAAIADWADADPLRLPSYVVEPDGTVRFDLCMDCVIERSGQKLLSLTEPRIAFVQ